MNEKKFQYEPGRYVYTLTDSEYLRDLAGSYGAIEYPDMDMDTDRVRRIADALETKDAEIARLRIVEEMYVRAVM